MPDLQTTPDLQTEKGFRTHISEKRHTIMRQPVVCAKDFSVLHHEWLVRFDSNTGLERILRPAEISGAISDLDLSMLAQAVTALNDRPDRHAIAVNLSGASFAEPIFERSLLTLLAELETAPAKLIFELTETWDLKDLKPALRLLNILRERGHSLCLDDVGAGAASLRYLRAFPTDWLKIDGGFVAGATTCAREKAVLKAVLGLRDALDVRFIAEGIESEPLRDFALELGFDALQGFIIAPPEPENLT
ncbi:MAG: EAL domain-containing protein [Robiginitomaculum sp.]|nr:EAL domain-containing protein [Robiginitomaculum sp.]